MIDGNGVLFHAPVSRRKAIVQVCVRGGSEWDSHCRLEAGAGLRQGLTNPYRDLFAVCTRPITEARHESLFKLPVQEALLDDRLKSGGKVLDAHESLTSGRRNDPMVDNK